MTLPSFSRRVVRWLVPVERRDDVLGDLEESHRSRRSERGPFVATVLTTLESLDVCVAFASGRVHRGAARRSRRPSAALRDSRPSLLDFKLGLRMLVKHPGLTVVAGLSIAFGTMVSVSVADFWTDLTSPRIPFPEAERLVEIRYHDLRTFESLDPRILHDYEVWRDQLRSVDQIGAFSSFQRNLHTDRMGSRPIIGAEITATAFGLPGVPPLMGRPLAPDDEVPGAPPVAVIGEDVWRSDFGGAPGVIGQTARIAGELVTVVGVMPEDFAWPWSQSVWTPFRHRRRDHAWGESPAVQVVARLAPGASQQDLQNEVSTLTASIMADHPVEREHVRADVVPYGAIPMGMSRLLSMGVTSLGMLFLLALIVLISSNVALLLFTRTAARRAEIVVRSALGASRGRVVAQLVAEAFVLGLLASLLGVWGAHRATSWGWGILSGMGDGIAAFWYSGHIAPPLIGTALLVSVVAASLAGALPALRLTRGGVHGHLQKTAPGGSTSEFGRLWTGVIVAQVAVTVAFVPMAIRFAVEANQIETAPYGVPADEYLTAELTIHSELPLMNGRRSERPEDGLFRQFEASAEELKRRLALEAGVTAVATSGAVPGGRHPLQWIEVEGPDPPAIRMIPFLRIDLDFFDAMEVSITSGRSFSRADVGSENRVAIVNPAFVEHVLEGRNPLGRRLALDPWDQEPGVPNPGPWYEIVGVSEQIAVTIDPERRDAAGIYVPFDEVAPHPTWVSLRVDGDPMSMAPRLRELAAEVDVDLLVRETRPMSESAWVAKMTWGSWARVLVGTSLLALLLSTAGIYSIMAYAVSRRTREIGVRVALGASRRRIGASILGRGLRQVLLGIVVGVVLFTVTSLPLFLDLDEEWGAFEVILMAGYLTAIIGVCTLACVVPTRRALRIEPTEALRADG